MITICNTQARNGFERSHPGPSPFQRAQSVTHPSVLITFSRPPGVLVYIGAGAAQDLDRYRSLGLTRAVLVEPNPDRVEALEAQLGDDPDTEILPVAIGARTGQGTLHLYNQLGAASLRKPTFASGLQVIGDISVEVYRMDILVSQLELDAAKSHLLIIDAPGVEHTLLQDLKSHKQLDLFEHIVLNVSPPSSYKGSSSLKTTLALLEDTRFRLIDQTEQSKKDIQILLTRDATPAQTHRILTEQRDQLSAATARIDDLEAELLQTKRLHAALEADLKILRGQHKALNAEKSEQEALLLELAHSLQLIVDMPDAEQTPPQRDAAKTASPRRG